VWVTSHSFMWTCVLHHIHSCERVGYITFTHVDVWVASYLFTWTCGLHHIHSREGVAYITFTHVNVRFTSIYSCGCMGYVTFTHVNVWVTSHSLMWTRGLHRIYSYERVGYITFIHVNVWVTPHSLIWTCGLHHIHSQYIAVAAYCEYFNKSAFYKRRRLFRQSGPLSNSYRRFNPVSVISY
jgi:hypothetical protein